MIILIVTLLLYGCKRNIRKTCSITRIRYIYKFIEYVKFMYRFHKFNNKLKKDYIYI
jgi:hypothetical protein